MKESSKILFHKPFMYQETVTAIVLIPLVYILFMKSIPQFNDHLILAAIYASTTGAVGFLMGFFVKYLLVRPAIELMDKDSYTPAELQRAVRSVSILPLAEAIVVFFRWSILAIILCVTPFYLKGYITLTQAIFGCNALIMTAMSITPFFYLASENSLVPFYQNCKLKGILDKDLKLFSLGLNQKLLITILLIAISPIGNLLGLIYLSIFSGLHLESVQLGFFLILIQTIVMTILNSFLLMKSLSLSVGRMSVMFEDMAQGEGDLTKRLHVTGLSEVGRLAFWFNEFMDDIERIVGHVRDTSLELHQAIQEVSVRFSGPVPGDPGAGGLGGGDLGIHRGDERDSAAQCRPDPRGAGHVECHHQAHRPQQAGVCGPDEGDPGDLAGLQEDRGHRADGERGGLPYEPSGARMPRWRRPVRESTGRVLRWWRARYARLPSAPPERQARSRRSSKARWAGSRTVMR